jgi:hypothetical protein
VITLLSKQFQFLGFTPKLTELRPGGAEARQMCGRPVDQFAIQNGPGSSMIEPVVFSKNR